MGTDFTHVIAFDIKFIKNSCEMNLPLKFPYWLEISFFKTKTYVRILIYRDAFALTHAFLNQH